MENAAINFVSKLVKTDVTALKIMQDNMLLIGIGNIVNIFNISSEYLIKTKAVFCGQKIHGFVPNSTENKIAIYGGKHVKIYVYKKMNIQESSIDIDETAEYQILSDWILTLIWCHNDTKLAFLTAHNIVQIWDSSLKSIISTHKCEEKCILYSGYLTEINNGILVMAGTVFSQVIVWDTNNEKVLQRIVGHKGVIFSISYCQDKNIVVTTSDDRSVRIWTIKSEHLSPLESKYWQCAIIEQYSVMYGHTARAMRAIINQDVIISIGEDATMCTWNLCGDLLNKRKIHHDGCLWALDGDSKKYYVVTGGSDSAVLLQNTIKSTITQPEALPFPNIQLVAKKVALTARGNIVCITEQGYLMYYDFEMQEWDIKHELNFSTSYCLLAVSACKQFIALGGIDGHVDIFAEPCKFDPNLKLCISQKLINGKLLSMHWVDRRQIVTCDEIGNISLWGSRGESCTKVDEYILPPCKERWLTAVALIGNTLIVGDRCGSIHLYKENVKTPIQTLLKVHGRLGVNSIHLVESKIITMGRDGCIRYFNLTNRTQGEDCQLQNSYNIKIPFEWIEKYIDKGMQIAAGFKETNLMVWNVKEHSLVLDINCGGGHRSWDITKKWLEHENKVQNLIRFIYVKNSSVYALNTLVQEVMIQSIVPGFHVKEINCVETVQNNIVISAGEDTAIRISILDVKETNITLKEELKLSNHLSSIRCMQVCPITIKQETGERDNSSQYILFTAGGRAQICAWKITLNHLKTSVDSTEIENYMLKGTDLERKKTQGWLKTPQDLDPETRFMSLNCIHLKIREPDDNNSHPKYYIALLAGCSDGFLRVYKFTYPDKSTSKLVLLKCIKYHNKCILKVHSIDVLNYKLVISMGVDGSVAFWNFTSFVNNFDNPNIKQDDSFEPFYNIKIHKAGINSYDIHHLTEDTFLLATGGDDNAIHVTLMSLKINKENEGLNIVELDKWDFGEMHCAQITGLKFVNEFLISASIDQRITVMKWSHTNTSEIKLNINYLNQYHTSVSDIQGMNILNVSKNHISVCVYGKGIELLDIVLPQPTV